MMNQKPVPGRKKETGWLIWFLWIALWLEVSCISAIFMLLLLVGLLFDDDGTPIIQIIGTFGLGAFIPVAIALIGMSLDNWFYRQDRPLLRYATLLIFILGIWAAVSSTALHRVLGFPFVNL